MNVQTDEELAVKHYLVTLEFKDFVQLFLALPFKGAFLLLKMFNFILVKKVIEGTV